MKYLLPAVLLAVAGTAATAQVSVMVRTDRTDLATEKNVPDPLERVRKRVATKGGTWDTLLANDTTCGGGAVAIAYSMSDRRYFLVTGKKTATEANAEAMAKAREYAAARKGWITTAGPNWFNRNEYRVGADGIEWVLDKLDMLDPCQFRLPEAERRRQQRNGGPGVRG